LRGETGKKRNENAKKENGEGFCTIREGEEGVKRRESERMVDSCCADLWRRTESVEKS
jgi:hypothetical protein